MAGAGTSVGERGDRLAGHTQIAPTLRWVNRNPARALAFLGLP
jgi:hypothetical protein